MREMRGEVGKEIPKKTWRILHFYDITGIKNGAKVVQIGLGRLKAKKQSYFRIRG